MNAAQLASVLSAAAAVLAAVAGLVKAIQAGRKVDAHTAQPSLAAHPQESKPQARYRDDTEPDGPAGP